MTRVRHPSPGFRIEVTFGDHPSNVVPLRFDNTLTHAPNFLARIDREQHFIVCFVTRALRGAPIQVLGKFGWAVHWDADVTWSAATMRPSVTMLRAHLFPARFQIGSAAPDRWRRIAVDRTLPTTNRQDERVVERIYETRRPPVCIQRTGRPAGFRANFFA